MTADTIKKLTILFTQERHALLTADYGALQDLAQTKEDYLKAIALDPPDKAALSKIKETLMENQSLISAALRGIAAARARLTALETVRDGLTTYDPSGKVASIATSQHRFEKKA